MIEKLIAQYIHKKDLNYLYDKKLYDTLYILNEINKLKYFILSVILGFFLENNIVKGIYLITVIAAYLEQKRNDIDFSMVTDYHSSEKWIYIFSLSYGMGVWSNYLGMKSSIPTAISVIGLSLFINGIHRFLKGKQIRNYFILIVSILITAIYTNPYYLLLVISSLYIFEKFNSVLIYMSYIILFLIFISIGSTTTLLFFGSLGIYLTIKNLINVNYKITLN